MGTGGLFGGGEPSNLWRKSGSTKRTQLRLTGGRREKSASRNGAGGEVNGGMVVGKAGNPRSKRLAGVLYRREHGEEKKGESLRRARNDAISDLTIDGAP